jgi:DNA-binding Lrp family transcriptional regulator
MDDKEIRKKILERLYQEFRERDVASMVPMYEVAKEIGIEQKVMNSNVTYLEGKGFIKYVAFGGSELGALITITPDGIDALEFKNDTPGSIQSIVISESQVGPIIQAKHIDFNPSIFLEQLNSQIQGHSQIAPETKKHWKEFLKEVPKIVLEQVIRVVFDSMKSGK